MCSQQFCIKALSKQSVIRSMAVCMVTFSIFSCSSSGVDDWEEHQKGVIRLVAINYNEEVSTGTAFSISDSGYYVTNHHVIEPSESGVLEAIESTAPARKVHPATVIWSDSEQDLAVVHVPTWVTPALAFYSSDNVGVKSEVIASGFPGSNDTLAGMENSAWTVPTIKAGVIGERLTVPFYEEAKLVELFEHDASVNSGNSGGPLFDACGRVVGINVAKATSSFDIFEAISTAEITGNAQSQINIDEGAFYAITSKEAIKVLNDVVRTGADEKVEFSLSNKACNTGGLNHIDLLVSTAALIILFGGCMTGLFMYFKRKMPDQNPTVKNLSKFVVNGMAAKSVSDATDFVQPADEQAYRGAGGEIVHSNKVVLECVQGDGQHISIIPGKTITVGRDPNRSDVTLLEPLVSRVHAKLRLSSSGQVLVLDLNSSAGTFIDDRKIGSEEPGQLLEKGQHLIFGSEKMVYKIV